jgi:polar amino acid transport system ATP-binding protein
MTALENVMEGPVTVRGLPGPKVRALAGELLDRVGLAEKSDVHPIRLSGGHRPSAWSPA